MICQAAHQAFERILYEYKTENMSIRRLLDGRVLLIVWLGHVTSKLRTSIRRTSIVICAPSEHGS